MIWGIFPAEQESYVSMIAQFQNSRRTMSPLWEDISAGEL